MEDASVHEKILLNHSEIETDNLIYFIEVIIR